ncbi:hypothetical protein ACFQ1M_12890 [Sungkyunkwania multivorans]|uniref:Uncharacterized protein n=1 Tax=Sungkyunkwania multivorans TaxID=1173618 RepID=A0ABW3D1U8_9FLAO
MEIYDGDGQRIAVANMSEGELVNEGSASGQTGRNAGCTVIDVQYAGLEQNGIFYIYEVTYIYDCEDVNNNGGPSGGDNNSEGPGGPGGGSGFGGSGAQPIDTVPQGTNLEEIIIDADFALVYPCQSNLVGEANQIESPINQGIKDNFGLSGSINLIYDIEFTDASDNFAAYTEIVLNPDNSYYIKVNLGS